MKADKEGTLRKATEDMNLLHRSYDLKSAAGARISCVRDFTR